MEKQFKITSSNKNTIRILKEMESDILTHRASVINKVKHIIKK